MARKLSRKSATAKGKHLTDSAAESVTAAARKANGKSNTVPGPSSNPQTNLIAQDIMLRSAGRLMRHTLEKGLLSRRYDKQEAKRIVENRTLLQTLMAYGVTKVATRSIPGALLVGGGILAKTLFDRSLSRRKSAKAGDRALHEQAEE